MPGGKPEGDGEIESTYVAQHDLREVFSRENASRRRQAGHTLRKYLTDKQDKQMLNHFVKIRDEYAIANNSDAVVVWAQMQIADGKKDDLHEKILEAAETTQIPKRDGPFVPEN